MSVADREESESPRCSLGGQEWRVSGSAAQLPACPPHQHIMKYLDFAPYFNGVRERDARNGGCGSVCAGGGRSSGDPSTRTVVYMSHCLFFLPVKRKGKMGVREWGGGGGAGEIILFWNLDSGAGRPRSQSIWPVWGGGGVRLGGGS